MIIGTTKIHSRVEVGATNCGEMPEVLSVAPFNYELVVISWGRIVLPGGVLNSIGVCGWTGLQGEGLEKRVSILHVKQRIGCSVLQQQCRWC